MKNRPNNSDFFALKVAYFVSVQGGIKSFIIKVKQALKLSLKNYIIVIFKRLILIIMLNNSPIFAVLNSNEQ